NNSSKGATKPTRVDTKRRVLKTNYTTADETQATVTKPLRPDLERQGLKTDQTATKATSVTKGPTESSRLNFERRPDLKTNRPTAEATLSAEAATKPLRVNLTTRDPETLHSTTEQPLATGSGETIIAKESTMADSITGDRFAEFNNRSSFLDISTDLDDEAQLAAGDGTEKNQRHTEQSDSAMPSPTDDLQWTIVPSKSTLVNKPTTKSYKPNVVRYYVKVARPTRPPPTVRVTTPTTTTKATTTPPTPSTQTSRKSFPRMTPTTEPKVTVALPESITQNEKLKGVGKRKFKPRLTTSLRTTSTTLKSTKFTSTVAPVSTSEKSLSRGVPRTSELVATKTTLPLSRALFTSITRRLPPKGSSSAATFRSVTKSWMFISSKKNKTSFSPVNENPLPTEAAILPTSTQTTPGEEVLTSVFPPETSASSLPGINLAELPSPASSQEDKENDLDDHRPSSEEEEGVGTVSVETADEHFDEPRNATVTMRSEMPLHEPKELLQKWTKPSTLPVTASTMSDLWWTPKHTYMDANTLPTVSPLQKTRSSSVERRKLTKVCSPLRV
ncbi:hypothetical protein GCK32_022818, partial [Trichostrongylus colubriformis]